MTYWLSEPIEKFSEDYKCKSKTEKHCEKENKIITLVIGSGYGAAMSSIAVAEQILARRGKKNDRDSKLESGDIVVFEKGDEYTPGDFPKTMGELPGHLNVTVDDTTEKGLLKPAEQEVLENAALWDIRVGDGATTIAANGLGGTSLVNAGVAMDPDAEIFELWPRPIAMSTPELTQESTPENDNNHSIWHQLYNKHSEKIKTLLGVNENPALKHTEKFKALNKLVQAIDKDAETKAAPLTVNFDKGNQHSANYTECNLCGNCVMGCHSGAKGSLNLNAWPLARQLGVEIYTGASVLMLNRIESDGKKIWEVTVQHTNDKSKEFIVHAQKIILAAGTIGSTEILLRSKDNLRLSEQLGKRFSTNGDALLFGVGQKEPVNAVADIPKPGNDINQVGTTITGVAKLNFSSLLVNDSQESKKADNSKPLNFSSINKNITLENSAVPYALKNIWNEIIVSQSFLKRYTTDKRSHWHAEKEKTNKDFDPLAVSTELSHHSQVLLAMGHDEGNGTLKPNKSNGRVTPSWKVQDKETNYYDALNKAFNSESLRKGFDGGEYHPNIFWKPLPDGFDGVLEGSDKFNNQILTVHPLGGCCMGEHAQEGVVNTKGQVFKGQSGEEVYEDLYVLDGSIIPRPIGTNPFMTIATLSYALASQIEQANQDSHREIRVLERSGEKSFVNTPAKPYNYPEENDVNVQAYFKERMGREFKGSVIDAETLELEKPLEKSKFFKVLGLDEEAIELIKKDDLKKIPNHPYIPLSASGFVVDVEFFYDDGNETDHSLNKWLEQPGADLRAEATLYIDMKGSIQTWPSDHLLKLGKLKGQVSLGKLDKQSGFEKTLRTLSVIFNYIRIRPYDIPVVIREYFRDKGFFSKFKKENFKESKTKKSVFERLKAYWRVAKLHTDWRMMHYHFDYDEQDSISQNHLASDLDKKISKLTLSGQKTLKFDCKSKNIWDVLFYLPVNLKSTDTGNNVNFDLKIDRIRITKGPSPLQIVKSLHTPNSLLAIFGMGGYFFRAFMQTYFWSFGAANYSTFKTKEDLENPIGNTLSRLSPPPEYITYGTWSESLFKKKCSHQSKKVEITKTEVGPCRLLRYQPQSENKNQKSILLIHGLAHSSRVFWTESIKQNFTQYLLRENYDVWIVDHRVSANLVKEVNPEDTWDDIALIDLPWAVTTIFNKINSDASGDGKPKKQVHVFAHCIGAGAISIAALSGKLNQKNEFGECLDEKNNPINNTSENSGKKRLSMIASLTLHAVTPWFFASTDNRTRANVWAAFKDRDFINTIEPLPHKNPSFIEIIYDRLATSFIRRKELCKWNWFSNFFDTRGCGFPRTIYKRYTVFWGEQWNYRNIKSATKKHFAGMIGATPVNIVQQVLFSIKQTQLTDSQGTNSYVTNKNLSENWTFPTLFTHGTRNKLFHIESTRRSAEILTKFRLCKKNPTRSFSSPPLQLDYLDNNVWIEIFKNYGHMDVIFGKKAYEHVYPKIHKFINAINGDKLNSSAFTMYDFKNTRLAKTNTRPDKTPITGPIISNPDQNKQMITTWIEANDFSTSAPVCAEVIANRPDNIESPTTSTTMLDKDKQFRVNFKNTEDLEINSDKLQELYGRFYLYKHAFVKNLCGVNNSISTQLSEKAIDINHSDEIDTELIPNSEHERYNISDIDSRDVFNAKLKNKQIWHQLPWFKKLFVNDYQAPEKLPLSFIVGSCRHQGTTFERELSDKIFRIIWKHVLGTELLENLAANNDQLLSDQEQAKTVKLAGVDHVLFLGDQIYADSTANIFDPKVIYEKYRNRYRQAFNGRYSKQVFANVPSYFVIDDHEIDNNWSGETYDHWPQTDQHNKKTDIEMAFREAMNFQMHHEVKKKSSEQDEQTIDSLNTAKDEKSELTEQTNSRSEPVPSYQIINEEKKFSYNFNSVDRPFFVLDTRSQRNQAERNDYTSIITEIQMQEFKAWLEEHSVENSSSILFIASASPISPFKSDFVKHNQIGQNFDTLLAYPGFLETVITLLAEHAINKKIIWLTGDPHISGISKLTISKDKQDINIYNIFASGLFAPYPFANSNKNDFDWADNTQTATKTKKDIDYGSFEIKHQQYLLSDNSQHFVRIDLDADNSMLTASAYNSESEPFDASKQITVDLNQGRVV